MQLTAEMLSEETIREKLKEMIEQAEKQLEAESLEQNFSEESLRKLLLGLGSEEEWSFEVDVVNFALTWPDELFKNDSVLRVLMNIPEPCSPEDEKIAFAAFCIQVNRERRMKNRTAESTLLEKYDSRFAKSHPFFGHLRLLNMLDNVSEYDAKEILQLAEKNKDLIRGNVGCQHALADAVALILEEDQVSPNKYLKDENVRNEWLDKGERAVNVAIKWKPEYAKYYCTRGRLLALRGKYDEALRSIAEAIDLEKARGKDYALRIGLYQAHMQQIRGRNQLMGMEAMMKEKMLEYEKKMEEESHQSMVKNLEFLGLFSGIVSFTIGSISIAGAVAEQSMLGAAGLIVVLMGALLGVFSGFGIILHGFGWKEEKNGSKKRDWKKYEKGFRNILVMFLGVLAIWGGITICLM